MMNCWEQFKRQSLGTSFTVVGCIALSILLSACESLPKKSDPKSPPPKPPEEVVSLDLKLCKTNISNPPSVSGNRVTRRSPFACVNKVEVMVAPAPKACLTSGFGQRRGRLHAGLDYQSKPAGKVIAAASGQLLIPPSRPHDFGNWLIVDHGNNVFTSYSHLASINSALKSGHQVASGQVLGVMGSSGAATSAVHLHYEVRTGKFNLSGNPSLYFLLDKVDPFAQPGNCT